MLPGRSSIFETSLGSADSHKRGTLGGKDMGWIKIGISHVQQFSHNSGKIKEKTKLIELTFI